MKETLIQIKNKIQSNSILHKSLITLFLRVFGVVTLFGFTLFLTNNYSAKIIGQYDFVRTFLLVIGSIVMLGMDQSVLFYSGKLTSLNSFYSIKNIYLKMIKIMFISSMLFFIFMILLDKKLVDDFFNDSETYFLLYKSGFILFFYVLSFINTETLRALDKVYLSELFRNTFKFLPIFLGGILLLRIEEPSLLIDFYLFGFIVLAIISTYIVLVNINNIKNKTDTYEITHYKILTTSYPMGISSTAIFLLLSIDIFLLKIHYGSEIVAYYSTAIKLMTILSMIIVAVNINLSSKIAELYFSSKIHELKSLLKKAARTMFLINLLIALILIFFGEQILLIFGKNYISSYNALIILVLCQVVISIFGNVAVYLNMTGKQKIFKWFLVIAVFVNLFLNFILIPKYEMVGAAISFMVSTLFWNIGSYVYINNVDKIKIDIF